MAFVTVWTRYLLVYQILMRTALSCTYMQHYVLLQFRLRHAADEFGDSFVRLLEKGEKIGDTRMQTYVSYVIQAVL